jgi:hypothetical protein
MRNLLYFVGSVVLAFLSILGVISIHSRLVQASSETFYTNTFIIGLAIFLAGLLMVLGGGLKIGKYWARATWVFQVPHTNERNAIKGAYIADMLAVVALTVGLLLIVASAILSTTL